MTETKIYFTWYILSKKITEVLNIESVETKFFLSKELCSFYASHCVSGNIYRAHRHAENTDIHDMIIKHEGPIVIEGLIESNKEFLSSLLENMYWILDYCNKDSDVDLRYVSKVYEILLSSIDVVFAFIKEFYPHHYIETDDKSYTDNKSANYLQSSLYDKTQFNKAVKIYKNAFDYFTKINNKIS